MLVGKQFGPFKVEKELGSGAMGAVFRGVDETTGKHVAIKIIAPGLASNKTAVERFLREMGVLKRLKHPNIARYLGSGRYHGTPFYIMEFIEGESLDHVLARRGRITWEEVVTIGIQLCGALQVAHDAGVIHRDLKPSNLMTLPDGSVKLTDFGIAKDMDAEQLTRTHSTLGTAAYMSPEQCRGSKSITSKSDLYSMGIMFYELITGNRPFTSDNPMDVFLMHVKGKCARPSTFVMDLPVWMDSLIMKLIEKSPDDRPFNAAKVGEELQSIAQKVADQTSAGLDRATKRRADRTIHDGRLDEEDKEIARTLLGKRKKTRSQPVHTRNWFTAAGIGGVVLALLIGGYVIFLKAPSADSLYRRTSDLMKSTSLDDHKNALEPIDEFLRYHPNHVKRRQIKDWRDQIELETCQFFVRTNRPSKDDPKDAWDAIEDEKSGRLDEANKRWKKVVSLKDSASGESRGWGLFAEKSLGELTQAAAIEKDVTARVRQEMDGTAVVVKGELDRLAIDGVRAQFAEHRKTALRSWEALKRLADDSPEQRPYGLLATKRLRELQ